MIIKFKKINSNVYYMGLVGFFMNFAAALIYTTLQIFICGDKKIFSQNSLILIRNLSEAIANFSKIFSGFVSDKLKNRKSFLLVGYSAMLLTKIGFLTLTFQEFFPLLFLQVLYICNQIFDRCMNAIRDPARDAVLIESSTPDTRGIAFGLRKLITSFGSIFSGIIVGIAIFLWQKEYTNIFIYKCLFVPPLVIMVLAISYILRRRIILVIFGGVIILLGFLSMKVHISSLIYVISILPCVFTVFIVKNNIHEVKKTTISLKEVFNFSLLKKNVHKIKTIIVLLALMSLLALGKLNDFCIFAKGIELGMSKYMIPFMFSVMYIAITIFSYILGFFIDKKKFFLVLIVAIVSLLLGNFLFGYSNSYLSFWCALILNSIFLSASDSAFASIIAFYMPSEDIKATIYGILYGLSGFIAILNTVVVAFLQNKKYALSVIYKISCIPIIFSLIILLFCYKNFKSYTLNAQSQI